MFTSEKSNDIIGTNVYVNVYVHSDSYQ